MKDRDGVERTIVGGTIDRMKELKFKIPVCST